MDKHSELLHPELMPARIATAARAWLRSGGDATSLAPFRDVTRKSVADACVQHAPKHAVWALRLCEERLVHESGVGHTHMAEPWRDNLLAVDAQAGDWRALLATWGKRLQTLPEIARTLASREGLLMRESVREHELRTEVRKQLGAVAELSLASAPLTSFARVQVQERASASALRFDLAAVHLSELFSLDGRWPVTPPRVWASDHLGQWLSRAPERRRPVQPTTMPSDDARLLRRIGEDYILATPAERGDMAALHRPDADCARAFGVALAHALGDADFVSRTKAVSRDRARDLAREVGRGAVVAAAITELVSRPGPRVVHEALEAWCEDSPPDWRWLLPARGEHARAAAWRAVRTGTSLAARLRELYDVDWWRNPRAPAFVSAWAHDSSSSTLQEAELQDLNAWVLSVERSIA